MRIIEKYQVLDSSTFDDVWYDTLEEMKYSWVIAHSWRINWQSWLRRKWIGEYDADGKEIYVGDILKEWDDYEAPQYYLVIYDVELFWYRFQRLWTDECISLTKEWFKKYDFRALKIVWNEYTKTFRYSNAWNIVLIDK